MIINENCKVLIIDDNHEEALPIIEALAIKGVPTIFWNGSFEKKPEVKLKGIRLVFLDMRFSAVTDSRSIITHLFTLLNSSISLENGPYILCMWSKHDNEYLEDFKNEILKSHSLPRPYLIINMEKNNFIQWTHDENEVYLEICATLDSENHLGKKEEILEILRLNNISEKIETISVVEEATDRVIESLEKKLEENNSLSILLMWENMVNSATKDFVNNIATFTDLSGTWDNNIKTLIQHLAKANAGKLLGDTAREYIVNALYSLNQMLPDELWNQLMKVEIDEEKFNFIKNPYITKEKDNIKYSISKPKSKFIIKKDSLDYFSFKYISELEQKINLDKDVCRELYDEYLKLLGSGNFKLLCERAVQAELKKPGSVYKIKDVDAINELSKAIFKNSSSISIEDITLVKLDISSSCDYAQNKLKRMRVMPGIMVPDKYFSEINNTDDIYCTPELTINNKIVKIAFNFHFIESEERNFTMDGEKVFIFRELILMEIKQKLSSYISRVGIINLQYPNLEN